MIQFQKFLEVLPLAATEGVVKKFEKKEILKFLEAKPIVLLPTGAMESVTPLGEKEVLDLPFEICFFEIMNNPITRFNVSEDGDKGTFIVDGILVHELSPRQYKYALLLRTAGQSSPVIHVIPDRASKIKFFFLGMVRQMLQRFYSDQIGTSTSRSSVKVTIGKGDKVRHRIGKVIIVAPKKYGEEAKESLGKEIEWSHRWRVRGHWRSIPGRIGKDREEMPIKDFTWVTDHVKGPEDQPIIEKVRVVK